MAELLIVVVVVAAVLLYAADRARKLRARARQMSGMNDRLAVAAAKIDEEQQRKRARVRASAELTSVLPAIKRPPLTIPGMGGHEPGDEDQPRTTPPSRGKPRLPAKLLLLRRLRRRSSCCCGGSSRASSSARKLQPPRKPLSPPHPASRTAR